MRPLTALLNRGGPDILKATFGGGGFTSRPFWLADDLKDRIYTIPTGGTRHEKIETSFQGYVEKAMKANAVVFACILARQMPFSEALFRYQDMSNGLPGKLSYGPGLELLERPWTNGTTGELLARMEQDASLAGNSYWTPVGTGPSRRLRRLRPDWVTIVSGVEGDVEADATEIDADVLGYIYAPVGRVKNPEPVFLTPDRVAHYSPIPDPTAQWRGMSWLTPVVSEVLGDSAATAHKLQFFKNGATSNFVVVYDKSINKEAFQFFVDHFAKQHDGVDNAYKTIHLGGGADAKVVGADLKQLDFKATQGAGETRIAAAAGVGAIIAQLSESMQGAGLMQGNFGQAVRRFGNMTLRPNWRIAAASLQKLTAPTPGQRLWYADSHIAILQQDETDAAEIFNKKATAIRTLSDAGFLRDSAIEAADVFDVTLLRPDPDYRSVQLQQEAP